MVADGTDFHKAKDVAAFANHLGGTILVGAKEADPRGRLERYVGLPAADAATVRDTFSKAVKDRCEPLPHFDCEEYEAPNDTTKRVVAVNVWPSLLLVGVRIVAHKPSENYGGDSYVYPVRSGTDANYLTPSQIAMYMTPQVRRVAVLISRINKGEFVDVLIPRIGRVVRYRFSELLEDLNLVKLELENGGTGPSFPLDSVRTVYRAWEPNANRTDWRIVFDDFPI